MSRRLFRGSHQNKTKPYTPEHAAQSLGGHKTRNTIWSLRHSTQHDHISGGKGQVLSREPETARAMAYDAFRQQLNLVDVDSPDLLGSSLSKSEIRNADLVLETVQCVQLIPVLDTDGLCRWCVVFEWTRRFRYGFVFRTFSRPLKTCECHHLWLACSLPA